MRKRTDIHRRRTGTPGSFSWFGSPLSRRWTGGVAVVVCVTVGAILLERWSRPTAPPEPNQALLPAHSSEKTAKLRPIVAGTATDQELIAHTKKTGERLVEEFPEDPRAITLAGHICWALDDPAKAVASWETCAQRHPDCAVAWSALGMDAFKKGDFEKAAQCFEKSYRLSPQMADGDLSMMVDALMNTGKPDKVVAVLEPLRKTRPASATAALVLGHAYLQLKEHEKAKTELLAAVALDPGSAKAHFALAQAFARLGDESNAQKHREQYTKLKGPAIAAAEGMRSERLKADLVDVRSQAARFLTWSAQIYAIHGRVNEAEQLWVTSLAIDPNNAETRRGLGMLYSTQGRVEEAREVARGNGRAQGPVRKQ